MNEAKLILGDERIPKKESRSVATVPADATPLQAAMQLAMQRGSEGLDQLERLIAMQVEHEKHEAKKAFDLAMAAFKGEEVTVFKRKRVHFHTEKGDVDYMHAELSDVIAAIQPALSRHQLSHRWDVKQEGAQVSVTCIITHAAGHSESVTMSGPKDDSGRKNALQQTASSATYLMRYTLLAATGSATTALGIPDDDGRGGAEDEGDPVLDELRDASLEGEKALRAAFAKLGPGDDEKGKPKPWPLWQTHGASLKDAAHKADAETAKKKAESEQRA